MPIGIWEKGAAGSERWPPGGSISLGETCELGVWSKEAQELQTSWHELDGKHKLVCHMRERLLETSITGDLCGHVPVLIHLHLARPGRENSELHRFPLDCAHSLPLEWKAHDSSPKLGLLNSGALPSYFQMCGLPLGRFHHRYKAQVC